MPRFSKEASGTTLLEALAVVVLLGLAAAPLLGLLVSAHSLTAQAGHEVAALNFAQELIEEVKSSPDNQIGKAQGSTANAIKLEARASSVNGFYDGYTIALVGGTGAGQVRKVTAYSGATRTATVDRNWDVMPDGTTTYVLLKVQDPERYPFLISVREERDWPGLRTVTVTVYYQDRGRQREVSLTTDKLRR